MKSKIQSFYEGKTIFLTGGTGFLGKVLVEKLFTCCPDIKRVYLLIREKRGESPEERLRKVLDSQAFSRLKYDNPDFVEKITLLPGDLCLPHIGLSPEHVDVISQSVDIVFHSAAALRFDERLSVAINTNVTSTNQICLLAQKIVNLQVFIYVSTAYCDCDKQLVQEKVPVCEISPHNLMDLPNILGNKIVDEATPILIGSKPNTYLFTKCAAEEVINSFKKSLPVAIFRPSIVLSAASQPTPGWIDNVLGPTGWTVGVSLGMIHAALFNEKARGNFVPVDYTVNGIIALGYSVGQKKWEDPDKLQIVNFVSTADNTFTWGRYRDLVQAYILQYPSSKLVWYPFCIGTRYRWSYTMMWWAFHIIPAYIIDWLSAAVGRPTRLNDFYRKFDKYITVIRQFSMTEYNFEERNAKSLWNTLDLVDQEMFPFNMASLDWNLYMANYTRGCRRFLLQDDLETVARSRKKLKMLHIVHWLTSSIFFLILLKIVMFFVRLVE